MRHRGALGITVCLQLVLAGCGGGPSDLPELGDVTGVVTLDGTPLPNAAITFIPENGSPSYGVTDEEGRYELTYSASATGAKVGKHKVRISTGRSPGEDEEGNPTPLVPEKVPVNYNQQTELTAEVKPGDNEIPFDLKSGGKIVQPDAGE